MPLYALLFFFFIIGTSCLANASETRAEKEERFWIQGVGLTANGSINIPEIQLLAQEEDSQVSLFAASSLAATAPPENNFIGLIEDVGRLYWGAIQIRISQLMSNYTPLPKGNGVDLVSENNKGCKENQNPNFQKIARIGYMSSLSKSKERYELKVEYSGCEGAVSFVEQLFVEGKDLKALSKEEILNGKREFGFSKNETLRRHIIRDGLGREITDFYARKTKSGERTIVEVDGQTIINHTWNRKKQEFRIRGYDYDIKYQNAGMSIRSNFSGMDELGDFRIKVLPDGVYHFFVGYDSRPKSESHFRKHYNELITGKLLEYSAALFSKVLVASLPNAEFISNGTSKMVDELNLALIQLNAGGSQLEQVKILLRQYLDAVENNEILDNRK